MKAHKVPVISTIPSKANLGWREWVSLPKLGIHKIKAKVDTGARTSALHAFQVEEFEFDRKPFVRFKIHPLQKNEKLIIECVSEVIDKRIVRDSGGHKEERWVIETDVHIGDHVWTAEVTLTARDDMLFRMLLGRTAIAGQALVDPERSFLQGKRKK